MRGKPNKELAKFMDSLTITDGNQVIIKFKELDEKGFKVESVRNACYTRKLKPTISIYGLIIKKAV